MDFEMDEEDELNHGFEDDEILDEPIDVGEDDGSAEEDDGEEDDDDGEDEDVEGYKTDDVVSGDEIDDEVYLSPKSPTEINQNLPVTSCCHYLISSPDQMEVVDVATICAYCLKPFPEKLECMINEIIQLSNTCCKESDRFDLSEKSAVLDSFLRYRHECLSSFVLKALKLESRRTDLAFNEVFPIASKRTPDFIIKLSEKNYMILEISAVSDAEKGSRAKGDPRKGYESKYEKELSELRVLGYSVAYSVLIFDMRDEHTRDHIECLNEVAFAIGVQLDLNDIYEMEYVRKEFCTATKNINGKYGRCYKYLFSEPYVLSRMTDFDKLYIYGAPENEFSGDYFRHPISSYVYDLSSKLMVRLPKLIEQAAENKKLENGNLLIRYDSNQDRFSFYNSNQGASLDSWEECLLKGWRLWVCKNMRVFESGKEVNQRADFEYFDIETRKLSKRLHNQVYQFPRHQGSTRYEGRTIYKDFRNIVSSQEYAAMKCKYEDGEYENKLLEGMKNLNDQNPLNLSLNLSPKPFCEYEVGTEMFNNARDGFISKMQEENRHLDFNGKLHVKQPFIYPLYSPSSDNYVPLHEKPKSLLNLLSGLRIGPYTSKIINICNLDSFEFGTHKLVANNQLDAARAELGEFSRRVNYRLKELNRESSTIKNHKIKDLPDHKEVMEKMTELNKKVRDESRKAGVTNKKIGMITMSNKKNCRALFLEEMRHFKSKKTPMFYKGVGDNHDLNQLNQIVEGFFSVLLGPSVSNSTWDIMDRNVYGDANLLKELKEKAMNESSSYYNHLKSTNLFASCEFISKFCHSLLFHSQTSANTSTVAVDNLGYRNVLLLVKGGKKIFGTKKTKLFRLIYPTYAGLRPLYQRAGFESSFGFVEHEECLLSITPWMNMNETVVTDGLTLCHRLMGFALINNDLKLSCDANLRRVYFNIILSLHNRRQTEMLLHNLRYVFMNCMSFYSAVDQILPELAGFNYDFIQVWLRGKVKTNFVTFAEKMKSIHDSTKKGNVRQLLVKKDLRHPFTNEKIMDLETLALSVYSTYLMSKSPTSQSLEQVSNLKSMLETHIEFKSNFEKTEDAVVTYEGDYKEYYTKLFKTDFNYDPKYCVLLGKFFGDYLTQIADDKSLHLKWEQILDESWNNLANTKGLRYKGKDFFGSKGYYVVNKDILDERNGSAKINKLLEAISSDKTLAEKEREFKSLNESYRGRIAEKPFNCAVFHVVDKKQRGGKREIFVMDLETKVHQQVIEKYMSYICKITPNEMISIPSNRRLQTVHSRVFESGIESEDQCFLVLDCRKWAPKSLIEKFLLFLSGMSGVLPSSFICHCQNFFYLLMKKKIYTRKYIYDQMAGNESMKKYTELLLHDEENDGYYYAPEYSWVMGIFNYFSSIFHVACQMHVAHMLRINFSLSYGVECNLHMIAHSDDSAGKINCGGKSLISRALFYYETQMHSANHLISKKKSNVGRLYYEFISILYIGGELLSLLAKFSGIFNFHPSDKGYCYDITEAYSKCIELVLNGSSLNQAYLAEKVQADLIYKFYFNKPPTNDSYLLPPSMFGSIDAHPLMVMMCGSEADTVRLMHTLGEDGISVLININESLLPLSSTGDGIFKQFGSKPNVKANKKIQKMLEDNPLPEEFLNSWSIKNVQYKNTIADLVQFLVKLRDGTFIAALQDETLVRRLSRSYYYRSNLSVDTKLGLMTINQLKELLYLLRRSIKLEVEDFPSEYREVLMDAQRSLKGQNDPRYELLRHTFDLVHNEAMLFMRHLESFSLKGQNIVNVKKTCKPIHFKVQATIDPCPVDFDTNMLVSWVSEPQYRFMLPDTKGLLTAMNYMSSICLGFNIDMMDLSPELLYAVSRKLNKKSKIEFFCYSNLPSGMREVSTYQDLMLFLAHNSNPNEYIKGLDVQYGKTLGYKTFNVLADYEDDDLQWTMSFYLVLLTCLKSCNNKTREILSLNVNTPSFLATSTSDTMLTLFAKSRSHWKPKMNFYRYLIPYMHQIEKLIDDEEDLDPDVIADGYYHSFLKRQFLVDNLWLGRGRLFVSSGQFKCVFNIINTKIASVTCRDLDHTLTLQEISYMNYCLNNSQLPTIGTSMRRVGVEDWDQTMFGVNTDGIYYIGKARDMVSAIDIIYSMNLDTPLSQLNLGVLRSDKRGKMKWIKQSGEGVLKYTLSFIPLSPQDAMNRTKGLIKNDRNNGILLSSLNTDPANVVVDMCVEDFDIEVSVDMDMLLQSHSSSMLYKILKKCDSLQLCDVRPSNVTYSHYPAQDGGLLRALIEYSKVAKNFNFNWDHVISEEYYSLKSSQPDAFTTELFDNLNENYQRLFSGEDKKHITSQIKNLVSKEGVDESSILKVACEWGYVGVQGAIEGLLSDRKRENFKGVRVHRKGALTSYYSKVFLEFNQVLYQMLFSLMKSNPSGFETTPINWTNINVGNYKNQFISHIHQLFLLTYGKVPNRKCTTLLSDVFVNTILEFSLNDKEIRREFQAMVSKVANFRTLPCDEESKYDWMILYNTLKENFLIQNDKMLEVNYTMTVDRDSEYERPYTLTKDFCAKIGLNFNLKRTYFSGALNSALYNRYNGNYRVDNNGRALAIRMRVERHINVRGVSFSDHIYPRHMFSAEFLDSDEYEDVSTELISADFDEEAYNDAIENYEGKVYDIEPMRKVKVVQAGKLIDLATVEAKVAIWFGGSYNAHNLSKLRQMSEDVVVVTDQLDFKVQLQANCPLIFRNKDENWFNLSLVNPQGLFIYVYTTRFKDSHFWEGLLCAKRVGKEEFVKLAAIGVGKSVGIGGELMDNCGFDSASHSSVFYSGLDKQLEESKEAEKRVQEELTDIDSKGEKEKHLLRLEESLRSSGMDVHTINKYMGLFKSEISKQRADGEEKVALTIADYFNSYFSDGKDDKMDQIKRMFSKLLDKELTKEQRELVFQVPLIFGGGRNRRSGGKNNKSLKNPYLISEMEAICPGLIWDLLSGGLGISSMSRKRWENHLILLNMMSKGLKVNRKGKLFLLNLIKMILRDAKPTEENDHDDQRWSDMIHKTTEIFVEGEDSESENEDLYAEPDDTTRYRYRVAGMPRDQ